MNVDSYIKPVEYGMDHAGDLKRIEHAVWQAMSKYPSREDAPLWLRMVEVIIDFQTQKLDRPSITYAPVEKAVAAFRRAGGF